MERVRSWLTTVTARIAALRSAGSALKSSLLTGLAALTGLPARVRASFAPLHQLRSRFLTALNGRMAEKFAVGISFIILILIGYVYAPVLPHVSIAQTPSSRIEDRIPVPEAANVPPPGIADLQPRQQSPAPVSVESRVPMPEPAGVPPITHRDLAPSKEAPAPAIASTPAANENPDAAPQPDSPPVSSLFGKDLIKAPLAASLATSDHGVAERLRELLAGKYDRFVDRREDRLAVEVFYRDRGFAPLWIENGSRSARASSAVRHLNGIGADGLDPSDYPVPNFNAVDAQALAEAELRFADSILDYARHAQTGRVHFSRVSGDIHYDLEFPDPALVLAKMAAASDVGPALAAYNPPHEAYKALKAKLAEARGAVAAPEPEIVRIPVGPILRPGMEDPRVAIVRKRLDIAGDKNNHRYDDAVFEAVKRYQTEAGLGPDGMLGPNTVAALNGTVRRTTNKADAILATMERWRWMPRDLGKSHVMLNIPDFTLKVVKNGATFWQTRVVVGKPATQTPLLSDSMKFITVNPIWNVPPSIIANEYLPALRQDSTVLSRMGLRLEENRDGTVRIYQPPGEGNALGRIRFNFPNKFLVYQHDTPDKHLFQRDTRAYSHGCMRVQDPIKYGEVLLSIVLPRENYTQERLRSMFGNNEININFPTPLPVHVNYQTAFVDDAGRLVVRDDLYGHDARLLATLKGGERRVADVPIPRRQAAVSREELRLPNGVYFGSGDRYGRNALESFFNRIFR